jgi:SAM-dependent methyltransferase
MHTEAWEWIASHATDEPVRVLDIGGRNVNGSPRDLFPNATRYTVLDILDDDGVDIVADAATWNPHGRRWDVTIAAETFEHTDKWPEICMTAFRALRPGGQFLVTTAAPGRPAHSAIDGQELRDGEYYGNVNPDDLQYVLELVGFTDVLVEVKHTTLDVRARARKEV